MGKRSALWAQGIGALAVVNVDVRGSGQRPDDVFSTALYASSTPTTVVGGTFSGNVAFRGSAIFVDDYYRTSRAALDVCGATFTGNQARGVPAGTRIENRFMQVGLEGQAGGAGRRPHACQGALGRD